MEHGFYDLDAMDARLGRVSQLTPPDDPRWCAVVELIPGQALDTPPGCRTDVFVLDGAVVRTSGEVTSVGASSACTTIEGWQPPPMARSCSSIENQPQR